MQDLLATSHRIFFIGIAGTGMSAVAQYLQGVGKEVAGSDRYFMPGSDQTIQQQLAQEGIRCYPQDGSGFSFNPDLVVVSTAIEDTVPEVRLARERNLPIVRRSTLLSWIAKTRRTIAVAGTSGKSTTAAMLYHILDQCSLEPGIITGAGLIPLIRQGKIGNAKVGKGEWLIIEADESDGSIIEYHPEIGLLLNIEKDHKEIAELVGLFQQFKDQSRLFVVNQSQPSARQFSQAIEQDFSTRQETPSGIVGHSFQQKGFRQQFQAGGTSFSLPAIGSHNMENALAATAAARLAGVSVQDSATALTSFEGIYRRHQVMGTCRGICLIDDYAHNPAKCAASIKACQPLAPKVIAWFQPHGYGPTRFLQKEFVREIGEALRDEDEIWMSEIYYAGGSAVKDISAADLVKGLQQLGKRAFFIKDRANLLPAAAYHFTHDCVLLLMGARDPSLAQFAEAVWEGLHLLQ